MDISTLVKLSSKAWSLTILSLLHAGLAGRQAPLLAASGASRTALAQSLEHLVELGLLERNPGHGHPLRPEFRLTEAGRVAGRLAQDVISATGTENLFVVRRAWTLPVLATLGAPRRFGEIGARLPRITDRALSQSLQLLETRQWVRRQVEGSARPPRPLYLAVDRGAEISQAIAARLALE